MRRGDFAAAWEVSDRIIAARAPGEQCWHLPRHEQWVWDGRPLADRTVLVRCYHGLGDTIQFARFLPLLASVAGETVVWAQPALLGLLARLPSVGRLLPLHDGDPNVDYDVDVEIMELAHALRVDTQRRAARSAAVGQVVSRRAGPGRRVGRAQVGASGHARRPR